MVTYLGLAYILPIQVGWWGGLRGDGNIPWTCIHTTIRTKRATHTQRTNTNTDTHERKDPKEKPIPANIAIKAC